MFTRPTVFILGAGASWHYGYPTGEGLVEEIIAKGVQLLEYLDLSGRVGNQQLPEYIVRTDNLQAAWKSAVDECRELVEGLQQVNPLVIDYYLGWNIHLEKIGKLLIAWAILEREQRGIETKRNINRKVDNTSKDDWSRFIVHQLAVNCRGSEDLLKNRVSFVTFNYDVSLESVLRRDLSHIKLFSSEDIEQILGGTRINHVYGRVAVSLNKMIDWDVSRANPKGVDDRDLPGYQSEYKAFLDFIFAASQGLHIIDPHTKQTDETNIQIARTAINSASAVYILGYGFDANNSGRLLLNEYLRYNHGSQTKQVYFTNFGDSNRVNRRASTVFFGNSSHFNRARINPNTPSQYESSVRNVYDAFELDFEIEE